MYYKFLPRYDPNLDLKYDLSENAIILRYIYLNLKPKLIRIKTYQYGHHFLLLVLIYLNLFRKVFFTTIHVPSIESL